ncbi:MAG TPA: 6-carboxytetrahydropterin synthase [Gammaproteobacteria bacterium]|nr:6-carboxytetrahydropterin synthase [Chromatiaceae bacterium]MCP5439751.1 6-carboxytetrahydropterin synthase [Chromatiaceae bacterium]HPE80627.1 6-carboxytetrahydropterin synthase [Gammaproteobacteria bacterium]
MTTLFVKRLTVIDCSVLSPARGLIGESWQVDVELDGDLDYQGMVLDFGEVKKSIKHVIDGQFDHKLLVPADYPGLQVAEYREGLHLSFTLQDGRDIEHRSPRDAVRLIPCERIAADRLAQIVTDYLSPQTPDNVSAIRVRLWPEPIDGAFYQYSHGLRHHNGNCQRIAHGHRSRIEILRNGQRDLQLEEQWADSWADIYIGTRADLIGISRRDGVECCEFGYRSSQGSFGLTLPRSSCYLIDSDSTVENIAQHIAEQLKATHPHDRFKVYAYEGVDKGAIGLA